MQSKANEIDWTILGTFYEQSLEKYIRKNEGIFYTPKYITQYICENTIGVLCEQKKHELNFSSLTVEKIQTYKNWLFELKILDPACGSGAFLIQALDFLIQEHKETDDLLYQLTGESFKFFDTDKTVLEKNIYGVDINDESIEIAKLSLWLHTAKKERKLSDLSYNLKCGNSLIDSVEVAGENAFNWNIEFAEIMQNGGFDVIIGNPPYVNIQLINEKERYYLMNTYPSCIGRTDIYVAFIDFTAACLLKEDGYFSFIIPYAYINQNYGAFSRKLLTENATIKSISDFSNFFVFPDAVVKSIVLTVYKNRNFSDTEIRIIDSPEKINDYKKFTIPQRVFSYNKAYRFETRDIYSLGDIRTKIDKKSINLEQICFVAYGARLNHKYSKEGKDIFIHKDFQPDYKPFLEGKNIERYHYSQFGWLDYQPRVHYNPMFNELFENEKIVLINIVKDRIRFAYDVCNFYNSHTVINCVRYDKLENVKHVSVKKQLKGVNIEQVKQFDYIYLLSVLNCNLMNWYFINFFSERLHFYPDDVKRMPIPNITIQQQQPFITLGNKMLDLSKDLFDNVEKFVNYLKSKFTKEKLTERLNNWYKLNNSEFLLELGKNKIALKPKEEADLLSYFTEIKQETSLLSMNIEKTDKEIDALVYELYNLTPEEIQIIENAKQS